MTNPTVKRHLSRGVFVFTLFMTAVFQQDVRGWRSPKSEVGRRRDDGNEYLYGRLGLRVSTGDEQKVATFSPDALKSAFVVGEQG